LKLQLTAETVGDVKYVVVNAAEDEPGSGKDRFLLERHPELVVEGALLAAWAIGSSQIVFYVSEALEQAREAIERELAVACERGLVALRDLPGVTERSGIPIGAAIVLAPTAYVAGEDTAALEVIEGRDGLPRTKPPYPAASGLLERPTVVANVETLAALPSIMHWGRDWYRALGTPDTPGTMLFTLGDEMARPGVYELELGTPLRVLLEEYGGGLRSGASIRAVLPGGPSSGFLPPDRSTFRSIISRSGMRDQRWGVGSCAPTATMSAWSKPCTRSSSSSHESAAASARPAAWRQASSSASSDRCGRAQQRRH
jgi:NADH-quinone oxidoreductase subunit F